MREERRLGKGTDLGIGRAGKELNPGRGESSSTEIRFRSILWGLLLLIGLSGPSCHLNCTESRTEALKGTSDLDIRKDILTRSYKVYCSGSTGSGSLVYENVMVTAWHVIEDSVRYGASIGCSREDREREEVLFGYGDIIWGWEVLHQDQENDIAILRRPETGENGRRLWKGNLKGIELGVRVYCSGFPWGLGPVFTSGYISKMVGNREYLIVSVNALPGSSGSGIYDSDGKFVGVLVRGIVNMGTWSQFIFHVIPLFRVESALEDLNLN